jgi:transcriptional regulator of arginine metabolism
MFESKAARQDKIMDVIRSGAVGTLAELQQQLVAHGVNVDASTLSRDLAELHIGKVDGQYRLPEGSSLSFRIMPSRYLTFQQFILSFEAIGSMVVICTVPGGAHAVALQIDATKKQLDCAGSIAGDDTVFVQLRSEEAARRFLGWLQESLAASGS